MQEKTPAKSEHSRRRFLKTTGVVGAAVTGVVAFGGTASANLGLVIEKIDLADTQFLLKVDINDALRERFVQEIVEINNEREESSVVRFVDTNQIAIEVDDTFEQGDAVTVYVELETDTGDTVLVSDSQRV